MRYLGEKFNPEALAININEMADSEKFTLAVEAKEFYAGLIKDILVCRAEKNGKDPTGFQEHIDKVLDWIESSDFYECPASTRYHDASPQGLLYHTLRVYNQMLDIIKLPKFTSVDLDSAALCCLVHDWCKIGMYEKYQKNVKDDNTGKWHKEDAYKYKETKPCALGHGVSSMFIASQHFKLTEDECLAIRWHMGAWQVTPQEMPDLRQANEKSPLVHLVQFSDQLAIVDY